VLIFSAAFITACGERWEGFVYPDKTNLAMHVYIGEYNTLEKCRDAAIQNLRSLGREMEGDYECGLNCETQKGWDDIRVCKTTNR
jgi:hypothetical protein